MYIQIVCQKLYNSAVANIIQPSDTNYDRKAETHRR